MDLLANNMANAATTGFKADREAYSSYFSLEALAGPEGTFAATSPVVEKKWTDFSQGSLTQTGNPLDLGISGQGFFVIRRGEQTVYTRDGSFGLTPTGEVVTKSGDNVLDAAGKPIKIDPNLAVAITEDGNVRQGDQTVAKVALVDVTSPEALAKKGSTYYSYSGETQPPASKSGKVLQGKIENSNFSPVESSIALVQVIRQFEMLQRAVTLGSELNRRSIEDVGKI
jgi:flagellar basal-body rod protein FlgF